MLIKICGITSPEDAVAAADAGADLAGLNFVSGPRRLSVACAEGILGVLPAGVGVAALIRCRGGSPADADVVEWLRAHRRVTHLQLYGEFDLAACRAAVGADRALMPVVPVRDGEFARAAAGWLAGLDASRDMIVLDAFDPQKEGGTGKSFKWTAVDEARAAGTLAGWPPILLAGGLRPENVADAIRAVRPSGVDVSSGVEFPDMPGRKDPARMRAFVAAVRGAEAGS